MKCERNLRTYFWYHVGYDSNTLNFEFFQNKVDLIWFYSTRFILINVTTAPAIRTLVYFVFQYEGGIQICFLIKSLQKLLQFSFSTSKASSLPEFSFLSSVTSRERQNILNIELLLILYSLHFIMTLNKSMLRFWKLLLK